MVDLRKVYTNLLWATKHREPSGVKRKLWNDETEMFQVMRLGEDNPVRVLVQGIYQWSPCLFKFKFIMDVFICFGSSSERYC